MLPLLSVFEKRQLLFLLLLASSLRLYVFLATPVIGTDGYNWFHSARCFAEGNFEAGLKHPMHPGYPVLFAGLASLTGEYELAGKAVALAMGVLSLFPLYLLTREVFGHYAGLFASFLLAVNPTHVRLSADIMSDTTYIFFFLTSTWIGLKTIKDRDVLQIPLLMFFISMAYLTRAEGMGLLVCILPWLIWAWVNYEKRGLTVARTFVASLLLALSLIAPVLYILFVYKQVGALQISQQGAALQLSGFSRTQLPEVGLEGDKDSGRIREPEASRLARWKQGREYHKILGYTWLKFIRDYFEPFFAFFLIGLFAPPRSGPPIPPGIRFPPGSKSQAVGFTHWENIERLYLFTPICLYFPIFCLFAVRAYYLSGRYVLPLVILSFVWAGIGIEKVSQYLAQFKAYFQKPAPGGLGFERSQLLLLLILLVVVLPKDLKIKRKGDTTKKEAGYWIKTHSTQSASGGNPIIVGLGRVDLEKVAFYAQGEFLNLPPTHHHMFQGLIDEKRPDYLIFYKEELEAQNPELFNRMQEANEFTFLKEWSDRENKKEGHLRVYRLIGGGIKHHQR
jgi:hypothetical protein